MPVPFAGRHFTFYNPDGSEIEVIGWGNQFQAVFETPDGYTVIKHPETGFYHYARLSDDQSMLVPTGGRVGMADPETLGVPRHIRTTGAAAKANAAAARDARAAKPRWEVRREQKRARLRQEAEGGSDEEPDPAPEPAAPTGNVVGLCLLIAFPDVPATISQQEISKFCNQHGYTGYGNNGSVCDYFLDVSAGRLHYTDVVTAYHTSAHDRAHYTDPKIGYGVRAQELIGEALIALRAGGFDFSQLSSDSEGYVYALNVFYAGDCVNNWAEGLWPHSSALGDPFVASASKTFSDYQITNVGTQLTLRTFCHENGHMVCDFPDLYDYGYESSGVGNYCLMCYGGADTNPVEVCAYLKYEAGWASTTTTLAPGMCASLRADANEFLLRKKNETEFFILENRQQAGRDASLPDAGLAIWHIDRLGSNSLEQMTPSQHYECSLEQADNRFDLERNANTGDGDDLFGAPRQVLFGDKTAPNSKWWNGTTSGLDIADISEPGPTMTVTMSSGPPSYPLVRRGDVNLSGVRTVQFLLRSNPSPRFAIAADGVFGPQTEQAVRLFQTANGLVVDGIAGQATWSKLVVTQRSGSRGEQVRAIQALLNIYGRAHVGYRLTEDGIFGSMTRAAVIRFQRAAGITDDGVVGPVTWPFLVHEAMRAEVAD
jgi:M6 family metalloprotease-like protein